MVRWVLLVQERWRILQPVVTITASWRNWSIDWPAANNLLNYVSMLLYLIARLSIIALPLAVSGRCRRAFISQLGQSIYRALNSPSKSSASTLLFDLQVTAIEKTICSHSLGFLYCQNCKAFLKNWAPRVPFTSRCLLPERPESCFEYYRAGKVTVPIEVFQRSAGAWIKITITVYVSLYTFIARAHFPFI